MFPQLCYFFVSVLIKHISFCRANQKNVLHKEIKDWTFEVYLLTREVNSWKTCAGSNAWFLKFLSNEEDLDCFLQP